MDPTNVLILGACVLAVIAWLGFAVRGVALAGTSFGRGAGLAGKLVWGLVAAAVLMGGLWFAGLVQNPF